MAIKSYLLFTTPFCKGCKSVKELLSTLSLKGDHIDASSDDGSEIAVKYNVQGVPTVVFLDEQNNEITRAHTVADIKEIIE
jgi:glutaredoxin